MEPSTPLSFIVQACTECGCPGIARPLTEGYDAILESASSVLYHFVTAGNLCQMIRNNRFTPSEHESSLNGGKRFMSFSRTGNFEEGWPALFYSSSNSDDWCMVRLTIDGDRFNTHPNVKDSAGRQHPVTVRPTDWRHAIGKTPGKEAMMASRGKHLNKFTGKDLPDSQGHPWAQSEDRLLTDSDQIPGFLDYVKRIDVILKTDACTGDNESVRRALARNLNRIAGSGKVHVYASLGDFRKGRECPVETITRQAEAPICESVHTARAVEVRKYLNLAKDSIRKWIAEQKKQLEAGTPLAESANEAIWIPCSHDFLVTLVFRKPDDGSNPSGAQFIQSINLVDLNVETMVERWRRTHRQCPEDFTVDLENRIGRLQDELYLLRGTDRISTGMLDGLDALLDTYAFESVITHELTHFVQARHGEKFDHDAELAKNGIDPATYDQFRHHELFPWEIDADVQGQLRGLMKMSPLLTASEMAKRIYDLYIHRIAGRYGIAIPGDRKRQCWETAVSLARAIKLASERDDVDEEDLDSIIAHIDDYAV